MNINYLKIWSALILLLIFLLPSDTLAYSTFYNTNGGSFSSSTLGNTTFFSNGVTASRLGNTTFYSNGETASTLGNTTFFSGPLNVTASRLGNTTFYSGDINATASTLGNTTFYSGDINGSASTLGGSTFYNTDTIRPYSYTAPTYTPPKIYYPSRPTYYNYQNTQAPTPTMNTAPAKTYGGGSEPTFQTEEAYTLWKQVHDHPAESLSNSLDAEAKTNIDRPDITSVQALGGGNVRITWNTVPNSDSYHIFYGPASGAYNFNTSLGNTTSHDVGGLPVGSTYFFSIQAEIHNCKEGMWGNFCYSPKGKEGSVLVK